MSQSLRITAHSRQFRLISAVEAAKFSTTTPNCGARAAISAKSLQWPTFFRRKTALELSSGLPDSPQWNLNARCVEARIPPNVHPKYKCVVHGAQNAALRVCRRRLDDEARNSSGQDGLNASRLSHPCCAGRSFRRDPDLWLRRGRVAAHGTPKPREPADLATRMADANRGCESTAKRAAAADGRNADAGPAPRRSAFAASRLKRGKF